MFCYFALVALLLSNTSTARAECKTNLNVSVGFGVVSIAARGYVLSNVTIEVPYARPSSNDSCPSVYLIDFRKPPFSGIATVDTLGKTATPCAATNVTFNSTSLEFPDVSNRRGEMLTEGWGLTVQGDRATYYRMRPLSLHELSRCTMPREENGSYAWTVFVCQASVFSKSLGLYGLMCRETPFVLNTESILDSSITYSKAKHLEEENRAGKFSASYFIVVALMIYALAFV